MKLPKKEDAKACVRDDESSPLTRRHFVVALGAASGALLGGCRSDALDPDVGLPSDTGFDARTDAFDSGHSDVGLDAGLDAADTGTVDAGPILPGPDGPTQFLTWDGGSGPSKRHWNKHLNLSWRTPDTGDWIDASGTPQGDIPYASVLHRPGPLELDVTSLVERWLSGEPNRGFYLRTSQAFPVTFTGRLRPDGPRLQLETSDETRTAPCTANAQWTPSSIRAYDSRERFRVAGNVFSIVQFDLSMFESLDPASLVSARLVLTCTEAEREGMLNVFEADPPAFRIGGGGGDARLGLAEEFPLDDGLDTHTRVLYAADFSESRRGDPWWQGSFANGSEQLDDPETDSTAVRSMFRAGEVRSCTLARNVVLGAADGTPDGLETDLYARYYVYLEADWGSTVDANKMPGWDCRTGWWNATGSGYWQSTTGNGGSPGTGLKVVGRGGRPEYEGHSMRGLGGTSTGDGNYYDDFFWLKTYMYHLDQTGSFGNTIAWPRTMLAKERWFCIEQHVRMNTVVGPFDELGNGDAVRDGVYRVWVDGVLTLERNNFAWTRHPELGLQSFWLNWYHGGTRPPTQDMHYRMNHLVIARDYIGPRVAR